MVVTEELFLKARTLFDMNLSIKQIRQVLDLSPATAGRMQNAKTFVEYRAITLRDSRHSEPVAQAPAPTENKAVDAPKLSSAYSVILEEVRELRKAVQWIADNAVVKVVEPNPTKRRFF